MSNETEIDTSLPAPEGESEIIQTDYEIGQDNVTPKVGPFNLDIHNPVFLISGATIVAFTFITLAFQTGMAPVFTGSATG